LGGELIYLILSLTFLIILIKIIKNQELIMDISKTRCPDCDKPMQLTRATCPECAVALEGQFEVSPLGQLSVEEQVFVLAFLRHHGSIRKMEELFSISYPTVKNRLKSIVDQLNRTFSAPSPNSVVLQQLAQGEISVDEALERME
jgi:hypothetical protein